METPHLSLTECDDRCVQVPETGALRRQGWCTRSAGGIQQLTAAQVVGIGDRADVVLDRKTVRRFCGKRRGSRTSAPPSIRC